MNYFAHAHPFLVAGDCDPYFLAGGATPDWLSVVARRTRCRSQQAMAYIDAADPRTAALARGIRQHLHDDGWFHGTREFTERTLAFSQRIGQLLDQDSGLRANFLGHVVVELLLDAELIAADRALAERYYALIESVDPDQVEESVGQICARPVPHLADFIRRFVAERFLFDYGDDEKLQFRLNQVMARVGLPALPGEFARLLPQFRAEIRASEGRLLSEKDTAP